MAVEGNNVTRYRVRRVLLYACSYKGTVRRHSEKLLQIMDGKIKMNTLEKFQFVVELHSRNQDGKQGSMVIRTRAVNYVGEEPLENICGKKYWLDAVLMTAILTEDNNEEHPQNIRVQYVDGRLLVENNQIARHTLRMEGLSAIITEL